MKSHMDMEAHFFLIEHLIYVSYLGIFLKGGNLTEAISEGYFELLNSTVGKVYPACVSRCVQMVWIGTFSQTNI